MAVARSAPARRQKSEGMLNIRCADSTKLTMILENGHPPPEAEEVGIEIRACDWRQEMESEPSSDGVYIGLEASADRICYSIGAVGTDIVLR